MIEIESDLRIDLGGNPCLHIYSERDQHIFKFTSLKVFGDVVRAVPVGFFHRLQQNDLDWLATPPCHISLRIGLIEIGTIKPGRPPSLVARFVRFPVQGLRMNLWGCIRALVKP